MTEKVGTLSLLFFNSALAKNLLGITDWVINMNYSGFTLVEN